MTQLIVSIGGDAIERIRAEIEAAADDGADMVELRLDLMEDVSAEALRTLKGDRPVGLPLLITLRSTAEGGAWAGPDVAAAERLSDLSAIADYVDVELALWRRSRAFRAGLCAALDDLSEPPALIFSRHDAATRPATLQKDLLAMLDEPRCAVVKLAWQARTVRDNFEAFEIVRSCPKPAIAICMGEAGLPSRVLAAKFGAFATFVAPGADRVTAPGQLDLGTMVRRYRARSIDSQTLVYGVVGDPVRHSLSPLVHNAAFGAFAVNAVYVPLPVLAGYESFKAFCVEALARPWMCLRGLSVTLPHKADALRFVEEHGGDVDALARRIGAANTIDVEADGRLAARNTDCAAAIDAICAGMEVDRAGLAGMAVAVLGAGGAARAVVAGLAEAGAEVTIYNRTASRAAAIADAFGCRHLPWEQRTGTTAGLLVNCTRIGLAPSADATPMPAEALRPEMAVFDTVYNPMTTRLLGDAASAGARTIDGVAMFCRQACLQFHGWTGRSPEAAGMERIVRNALAGER